MNWKRSLFVVTLVGVTAFAAVGCAKTEQATPSAGQSAPANAQGVPTTGQSATASDATRPAPPTGVQPGERPPTPAIDYATAAFKLGVTEQALREALGEPGQKPPDFAAAAQKLGVTEQALQDALGLPAGGPPPTGAPPAGNPPSGGPGSGS